MMRSISFTFLIAFITLLVLGSCKSDYQRMKDREMAKGVRVDSLFLGIHLGMERQAFFDRCTELNKQQLITQGGAAGLDVTHTLDGLKYRAGMDFYPTFRDDKIYEMPVDFHYYGWSPWAKDMFSDKLVGDVVRLLEEWYGKGFIRMEYPGKYPAYVKVDGNRRILVAQKDDQYVRAIFTDLLVQEEIDKEKKLAESKK